LLVRLSLGQIVRIPVEFLFTATIAAFCCLALTRTGAAPEDAHRGAEAVSKDGAAASDHWTNAAGQGDAVTPYEVGQNNAEAIGSIRKAADQGLAQAQYDLGRMYATGQGVEQDLVQAAVWYRKAAEQRLAVAQFSLGYVYLKGRGVEQDPEQAVDWYRRAADQGNGRAQFNLALSYERGRGVHQDFVQAMQWFILAVADGVPEAESKLERLEHRATRPQIAEAQALASRWQPSVRRNFAPGALGGAHANQACVVSTYLRCKLPPPNNPSSPMTIR